jgi:NAD(P)-dependent dehydrogenase (short-subunit alcohol dehydrogenase family)
MGAAEMRFVNQVAVVTGAAQSIGLACASAFGREGARVVIADINLDQAQAAAESLTAEGLTAIALALDVRRADQCQAVVSRVVKQFGRLDVWVNNAGIAHHCDSFDLPPDLWQNSLDVLLSGAFYSCQAAGRAMRAGGGGAIVNMASVNGLVSQPRRAAYATAKAGLIMLTRVLAAEWAAHRIRVNAVAPSPVATSGMAACGQTHGFAGSLYVERHPMERMAELHEVTDAVLFLASDEAAVITGETLCVDGGWTAYGYL